MDTKLTVFVRGGQRGHVQSSTQAVGVVRQAEVRRRASAVELGQALARAAVEVALAV